MSGDAFLDRCGVDLEEAFFKKQNLELLKQIQERVARENQEELLATVTGIQDKAILGHLVELGVTGDKAAVMAMMPLVHVAWCDGSLAPNERDAIMKAAAESGIQAGSPGLPILEQWLSERPSSKLIESWKAYVGALGQKLSVEERLVLRDRILGQAQAIADSAGGFLGMAARISAKEKSALAELAQAFE